MWIYIVSGLLILLSVFLVVQKIRCNNAVKNSKIRLALYKAKSVDLECGKITYIDSEQITDSKYKNDSVILSVHGIFGGYDQAFETCKDFLPECRVIAPSRFGYLGSDSLCKNNPTEQAKVFCQLLDKLGIKKVFVLATSAGGSVAIRFALDFPERTKGLILYCSAMPFTEKPKKIMNYAGPPPFLCTDYGMFLISPMFKSIMGIEPSTIYQMMPISQRKKGVILDATITNLDMAKYFDEYVIESLQASTLILHAKDDRLANYDDVKNVVGRFPNCTFISFENGGHLMQGHGKEIKKAVLEFINENKDI